MKPIFFLLAFGLMSVAHAQKENPMLQYTMKAISGDVTLAQKPVKAPVAADVLDGTILTAIVRSRTAQDLLQVVLDRRGAVQDGRYKKGEMSPAILDDEADIEVVKTKLNLYAELLLKAKTHLKKAEVELTEEYNRQAKERDFAAARATFDALTQTIIEGHRVFRPAP